MVLLFLKMIIFLRHLILQYGVAEVLFMCQKEFRLRFLYKRIIELIHNNLVSLNER